MSFLGRAESWVEASITDENFEPNCFLLDKCENLDGMEIIDILTPMTKEIFQSWRLDFLQSADKKSKKHIENLKTMFDAICIETPELKKNGWSQPPGSKWVQYVRKSTCFDVNPTMKEANINKLNSHLR